LLLECGVAVDSDSSVEMPSSFSATSNLVIVGVLPSD
jgi:hypothetical protein